MDYHPNWRFFQSAEWYLTCREIAHAADILNAYCQSLLADALEHSPDLWERVAKRFKDDDTLEEAIGRLRVQRESDGKIRAIWGKDLGTFWNAEMDLIAILRNKIVHQGGFDPEGTIPRAIQRCQDGRTVLAPINQRDGEIPISLGENGRLEVDARAGKWATDHVLHNIHMMDQNCMGHFNIPGRRYVMRTPRFSWRGGSRGAPFAPGQPLPTTGPEPENYDFPKLHSLPEYQDMTEQKEIECAQTWRRVMSEIHEFVEAYCEEVDAGVRSFSPGMPGSIHPHTIRNHEHHLGYRVADSLGDGEGGFVGIRLRQRDFDPFLTVWSDETMMKDFNSCELTEDVKDAIRQGIDRVMGK